MGLQRIMDGKGLVVRKQVHSTYPGGNVILFKVQIG